MCFFIVSCLYLSFAFDFSRVAFRQRKNDSGDFGFFSPALWRPRFDSANDIIYIYGFDVNSCGLFTASLSLKNDSEIFAQFFSTNFLFLNLVSCLYFCVDSEFFDDADWYRSANWSDLWRAHARWNRIRELLVFHLKTNLLVCVFV